MNKEEDEPGTIEYEKRRTIQGDVDEATPTKSLKTTWSYHTHARTRLERTLLGSDEMGG
jgi:hypothetical protein